MKFLNRCILLMTSLAILASSMTLAIAQEVAPNFTLTDIDGVKFSLSDQKGKVVLLDFFEIMCVSCVDEIQHLNVLHQEFGENVTIVSISVAPVVDTVEKLQQFRLTHNMSWIVARDTEGVSDNYSVQVAPTLVIVDKEGAIQYRHVDLADESVLRQEISQIVPEFGTIVPTIFVFFVLTTTIIIYRRRSRLTR